jgi:hypothetical protein
MKPCPCECGRQVGWSDGRVANSASEVLARLPYVYRITLHIDREVPSEAITAHQFVDAGVDYARRVLNVAHGDHSSAAKYIMPSISDGVRWIRRADQLRPDIGKIDPDWWSWYRSVDMPKADILVLGEWKGQLRGGPQPDEPRTPHAVPREPRMPEAVSHKPPFSDETPEQSAPTQGRSPVELACESPRVAGLIGAHEINWMIAQSQLDKLINLPDQRPCTDVALAAQLNRLAEIAGND